MRISWRARHNIPRRRDCIHCKERSGCRPAHLCNTCYQNLSIREKYVKRILHGYVEPTEEELDEMIREQMKNLPSWWDSSWPKGTYLDD